MSNIRRATRLGLPILFASLALVVPAAAQAGVPSNVIVGTPEDDVLRGHRGPDIIFGLPGDDTLFGNLGADRVFGGRGEDILYGGHGPDTLRGGLGADWFYGGPGSDLILAAGDEAIDKIRCGQGRQDLAIVDPEDLVSPDCEFVWVRDPEA